MEIKILQVFYDKNGLPYKDKERTVHYPITSGTFLGASNTTQIRFYYDQLDELNESTFVAVSKLPNGKIGSEILEIEYDSELQENYAVLNLSSFYTQYKGDVYISLQGYQGGVKVEQDENGIYQIYGTPTIQATGSIKLSIAYAPTFIGSGQTENITLQRVLAELSTKLGIRQETLHVEELPTVGNPNIWYVVNDDPNDPNLQNIYVWNENTRHYIWVGDNRLNLGEYYTKEQGEDFEEEIDGKVVAIENLFAQVNQLIPSGVDTSTNILAFEEDKGIWVGSDTGNWYYWDGTQYVSGGTYQASQIGINEIELENLKSDLVGCFTSVNLFDKTKIVSGYYNSSGVKQNDAGSQCSTQYIPVKYGVTYKLTYAYYAFQFCTYDKDGNFIERINVTTSTVTFGATVAFVRISYYSHSFSNSFMFCDESKYPSTYQDYKLTPDIDSLLINGNSIKDKSISWQKLEDDTIPGGVAEKNILSTLSLSNLPVYSVIDMKCYVGSTGTKESSNGYNSISILALQNFNIWVTDITGLSYFSLGVFNNGTWNSANFVARYRNSDNNLPTSENKLTLSKGQLLVITYPVDNDFECGVDNLIYNYIFKDIFALNSAQILQAGNSIIGVTKDGDNYSIKMGKYSFHFNKATNAGTYLDSYDIDKVYLNENQLEAGNILGVVKEHNQSDFMGGVQHGDETIISMNIYCDGSPITNSVSCKRVDIYLVSNFTRVSDHTTNVIKRLVHIVFENNKMTVETTFKCLVDNFNCDYAYVGMWGQYTSTISKIFNNVDEYDTSNYHGILFANDKLKWTSYVGANSIVTIKYEEGYKNETAFAKYAYYSDTLRLKTYFCLAESVVLNTRDELYGKTVYEFN